MRLAVCLTRLIIETVALSRKRNACIACMHQANGGRMPEMLLGGRSRGGRLESAFGKMGSCLGRGADFRVVLLDAFV